MATFHLNVNISELFDCMSQMTGSQTGKMTGITTNQTIQSKQLNKQLL